MKMEKKPKTKQNLPIPDSVPYFSICNHILRYLLTPWKKYLTFITTNKQEEEIFFCVENDKPIIVEFKHALHVCDVLAGYLLA